MLQLYMFLWHTNTLPNSSISNPTHHVQVRHPGLDHHDVCALRLICSSLPQRLTVVGGVHLVQPAAAQGVWGWVRGCQCFGQHTGAVPCSRGVC
jgi:hypothetical protein